MADPTDEKRTGFADLSAELRNKIYRLVLTTSEDIELFTYDTKEKTPVKPQCSVHPEILRTCRQIQDEATSILYAENTFTTTATILCDWAKQIGSKQKHLRSVVLTRQPKHVDFERVVKLVCAIPGISTLKLNYNPFTMYDNNAIDFGQRKLAVDVWPFVLAQHKQHKGTDTKAAMNVVDFGDVPHKTATKQGKFQARVTDFKRILEKQLREHDGREKAFAIAKERLETQIVKAAEEIARRRQADLSKSATSTENTQSEFIESIPQNPYLPGRFLLHKSRCVGGFEPNGNGEVTWGTLSALREAGRVIETIVRRPKEQNQQPAGKKKK